MKFDEVLKQLEPSMAVPMYSKALLIDFMRKAYDEGFKACAKSRLNVTTISDCPIKDDWHYVKDGDLPKENKLYFVAIKDNGCAIAYFNGLHWETKYNLGDFGHLAETVIAWCEIPTFDKE